MIERPVLDLHSISGFNRHGCIDVKGNEARKIEKLELNGFRVCCHQ